LENGESEELIARRNFEKTKKKLWVQGLMGDDLFWYKTAQLVQLRCLCSGLGDTGQHVPCSEDRSVASFYNKQTEQYNSHAMPLQVKCIPFSVLLSYINQ